MKAIKRPLAVIDIVETAEYIAREDLEIAIRFANAVEKTIEMLRWAPKIGALRGTK